MAGLTELNEELPQSNQVRWIKPRELLARDQEFCLTAIEQDSFNQQGDPQYTLYIVFVHEGQLFERSFNLAVNEYRKLRFALYQKHLTLHKLHLVERNFTKGNRSFATLDLEDMPGSVADGQCACNEYGVLNPADPATWTEHYRLTREINDFLAETKQPPMDTGNMSVKQLESLARGLGLKVAS